MAKRPKRHAHHEEHMDESWLIPYADLLTLLLALFIVLFASSEMDAKKFDQMVRSFSVAINGGTGVMNYPSPVPLDPQLQQQTLHKGAQEAEKQKTEEEKRLEEAVRKETEDLKKLQTKLDGYIQQNKLQDKLQTKLTEEGLLITILDNALFDSGKADLKPEARKLASEMAAMLVPHPKKVTVTGHTDNVPIRRAEFPSNWDLSAKRSVNFLKVLLENKNLDPTKFSATGLGEYHPVAPNTTAEGRAKNRRVEVAILRDLASPPKNTVNP
ncbi:flagellar motor protein MotB [Brevibacillus sp. M2.1A]|uniref:flagellar motor protein MotB n=1 Tax=Brevibacillus TaxID=55080 RepID=UPI00156B410B|nr:MULTISPECIES: flagellar motor protein MotB [Brevibacillus]MBY0087147.1 flagellar motor protein MotB [Brevibacillus brevis]MCC8434354.1 flagellar motor protein MotB [Brevibacillus sp. M2.1A]MCE0453781.1 flagellar motor protein MotB [Brevibacillus sp. AF8]UKK96779.1 flagellar motor protein MotB [Brevibacillus brevis]